MHRSGCRENLHRARFSHARDDGEHVLELGMRRGPGVELPVEVFPGALSEGIRPPIVLTTRSSHVLPVDPVSDIMPWLCQPDRGPR